jgi:hypothetical protein
MTGLACAPVSGTIVKVPPDAGVSDAWGDWAILREPPPGAVVLDLTKLASVDPLFVLRLRGFIDWHCFNGHEVRVVCPSSPDIRAYLARMHLAKDLPSLCKCDLETLGPNDKSTVLIPIRRLSTVLEGEELEAELEELYMAHFTGGLSGLAEPFTATVSEICDNATTHGRSDVGAAYVSAQRYTRNRCVLVIGDLGVGIPAHMRGEFPDLIDDGDAIRFATKEGFSGTGDPARGIGHQFVIDALKDSKVPRGELRIWSGRGRFRVEAQNGVQGRRRAWTVEHPTVGTWRGYVWSSPVDLVEWTERPKLQGGVSFCRYLSYLRRRPTSRSLPQEVRHAVSLG